MAAYLTLVSLLPSKEPRPWLAISNASVTVRIVRIGPRKLDSDNCAGACKHVRDGIADAIGIDDGDPRYTWIYDQEKGREYSVRITVTIDLIPPNQ